MSGAIPQQLDYAGPTPETRYSEDRKRSRRYGGQILFWTFFIALVPLMDGLGLLRARFGVMRINSVADLVTDYLLAFVIAVALIWWAIGAIRIRRWVRPMAMIFGEFGFLIFGLGAGIQFIVLIGHFSQAWQTSGGVDVLTIFWICSASLACVVFFIPVRIFLFIKSLPRKRCSNTTTQSRIRPISVRFPCWVFRRFWPPWRY